MIDQCLDNVILVWGESLVGGAVIILGAVIGWRAGRARRHWPVRPIMWWLEHVVSPLIASRSWARRTVTIAANNSLICALVVLLGSLGHVAWLAIASVGLALGIALQLLWNVHMPQGDEIEYVPASPRRRALELIGIVLNLLEVPAIMLAAGSSLAQGAMSCALDLSGALWVFGWVVFPLLVVSAAGEALWMTVNPDLPSLWRGP